MKITRREVLRTAGGAALGLFFTPMPWKILSDSAKWTQNWPWIPEPARGPISFQYTTCSLCPAACGLRVRCVGNEPVAVAGIAGHPLSGGSLCPAGMVAHHLRYHPARLHQPVEIAAGARKEMSLQAGIDRVAGALRSANGQPHAVAVLDPRPGRSASVALQQFAAACGGQYVPVASCDEEPLVHLATMAGIAPDSFGSDPDNAKLILSFGVPVLDGWGSPARIRRTLDARAAGQLRLIQIEAAESRTASMADQWIPARPGTEGILALAMAHVILSEHLAAPAALAMIQDRGAFETFVGEFAPASVSASVGIPAETIVKLAREFTSTPQALALVNGSPCTSAGVQNAVMILNILSGSVRRGGTVQRRTSLSSGNHAGNLIAGGLGSIPDHVVRLLIIDESLSACTLPDSLLAAKLADGGLIVSLSPFVTDRPFAAQITIPAPVMLESLTDLAGPVDRPTATMAVAAPLHKSPLAGIDTIAFVGQIASAAGLAGVTVGTMEETTRQRIGALHTSAKGTTFNATAGQSTSAGSADDLWNALTAGGCWTGIESTATTPAFRVMTALHADEFRPGTVSWTQVILMPFAHRSPFGSTPISPLMSKVSQESTLRPEAFDALLHPETAASHGLTAGDRIALSANGRTLHARSRFDRSIMPGIVMIAGNAFEIPRTARTGSTLALLCERDNEATLRPTPVTIQKA